MRERAGRGRLGIEEGAFTSTNLLGKHQKCDEKPFPGKCL
jgi:hypothetical protein